MTTPDGGGLCWRCRWAELDQVTAHVELEPFVQRHQTAARLLVTPEELPARLPTWQLDSLHRLHDRAFRASTAGQ